MKVDFKLLSAWNWSRIPYGAIQGRVNIPLGWVNISACPTSVVVPDHKMLQRFSIQHNRTILYTDRRDAPGQPMGSHLAFPSGVAPDC